MANESIVKKRLSMYLKEIGSNNNQFVVKMGYAPTFLNSDGGISESKLTEISIAYPNLDMNWLLTGQGGMFKNISENSENLSKQNENNLRISIDGLINKKIKEAVMENLDKTITAIMDGMNRSNQQQNEHVEKILKIQSDENAYKFNVIIDAIREIIKDEDKEKFESKIVQLKTKIG